MPGKIAGQLDRAEDRTRSPDWVAGVLGRSPGSLRPIEAGARSLTDRERPLLSLINTATVRALAPRAGGALDPLTVAEARRRVGHLPGGHNKGLFVERCGHRALILDLAADEVAA